MLAEYDVVLHVNDVHCIFEIVFLQKLQNLKLYTGLVVIFFLVFDDLQSNFFLSFVVKGFHGDAEASFTEETNNLVSEGYVIFHSDAVIAFTVVESKVGVLFVIAVGRSVGHVSILILRFNFFDALAEIEDVWVVQYLCTFIVGEMVAELFQALCWCHRKVCNHYISLRGTSGLLVLNNFLFLFLQSLNKL